MNRASLVAQMIKCLPAMRETQIQSLGWEDLLEKEMATHSGILAWRITWTEEPGELQSMGSQRVRHDLATEQQSVNRNWSCTSKQAWPLALRNLHFTRKTDTQISVYNTN